MADDVIDPVKFLVQAARTNYAAFVSAVHRPRFKHSTFSARVCKAIDEFVDDVIAGKRPVLMLTTGPQHGKSSLISRCLPAYLFGRLTGELPAVRVACASYAMSLARRNTRDAKSIMAEPIYREIFPHTSLIDFKGVDNADGFDVPLGGQLKGVGVGGGLTGFSVDCFASDTLIDTDHGSIRVDELHLHAETVKVLSYDKNGLNYARIKAIGHREATRLYRITTQSGRILEVTGNHPIYRSGSFVPAAELTPGDVLLCAVPRASNSQRLRVPQVDGALGKRGVVLRQGVHGAGEARRDTQLSGLWEADELARRGALPGMSARAACEADSGSRAAARNEVRGVREPVHVGVEGRISAFLQHGVQELCALEGNLGRSEPALGWRECEAASAGATARESAIPLRQVGDTGTRRGQVRNMCEQEIVARAPHKREPVGEFRVQFVDPMFELPQALPQPAHGRTYESDVVAMVEVIDGTFPVFDVQVGTDECLFAGGILAHNCAIIDDPTKDAQEALSAVVQESRVAWYDSVLTTRLQARSGTVIIGTPWSAHDLLAHIQKTMTGDPRFKRLSFPVLNYPDEIGFDPDLPHGALVPHLHSEEKLREVKKHMSVAFWASMYQQTPLADFGAIFPRSNLQHYRRAELPQQFQQVVMSVDATFKDGDASDFVAVGVWGKTADERVWLLDFRRERLAFMATAQAIADLKRKHPRVARVFIEEAANGMALLDMLRKHFPGLVGVPPLGSKEARAHAVAWVWQNNCVMLPHPDEAPGIAPWVAEITSFPDVKNDDTVDCMTIALHQLCLRTPIASMITQSILNKA